jgi:hypothetical protein
MEGAIDNNFSDIATGAKTGAETATTVGFFPQYPCTVAANAGKSTYWGYCFLGVTGSRANADSDYDVAKQIIAKGDPTLAAGTPPAAQGKTFAQAEYQNDTHAVYVFEAQQDNGKYIVKMTFAKPAALK